jgi:hypothetical protein
MMPISYVQVQPIRPVKPSVQLVEALKITLIVVAIIYALSTVLILGWTEIGALVLSCDPHISWFFFVVLAVLLVKYVMIASYVLVYLGVEIKQMNALMWKLVECIGGGLMLLLSVACIVLMVVGKQSTLIVLLDPYTLDMLGSFVCSAFAAVYLFVKDAQ